MIYNDYNKVVLFWNFYKFSRIDVNLVRTTNLIYWNITVLIKIRKTLQEKRLSVLKFLQDNPQNNFLNFLISEIFSQLYNVPEISLKLFWTDIRGLFLKYRGNITLWLLEFTKISAFVIIKSYTFNKKVTFPLRIIFL